MSIAEAGLALMADAQNAHRIERRVETVERDVSGSAPRDDQLSQLTLRTPADQRMPSEHLYRGPDVGKSRDRGPGVL